MPSESDPAEPPSRIRDLRLATLLTPPPSDFSDFWLSTLDELAKQTPSPDVEEAAPTPGSALIRHANSAYFRSLGGKKVHAFFSPKMEEDQYPTGRPLLVSCHGYGGQADPERVRRLSTFGFDVVSFDARGFGRSTEETQPSPHGYILTGIEAKHASILRGAVCDFIQARRAAQCWFGTPPFVAFQGFSFAGGLSVMASGVLGMASLDEDDLRPPDLVAVGAPTFGDQEARARICQAGSGHELSLFLMTYPEKREQVLSVLRYFDTVYFAPFVQGRILFGVGLDDPVVPAVTVYPIKNALSRDAEFFEFPCSHTTRPEEQEWIRWESAWIRALRDAQPSPVFAD